MKKNIFKISIFLFTVVAFCSCKKDSGPCFESVGSSSSETRVLPSFNQISLYDDINLFIAIGLQQVQIQGGQNLIKSISTDVSNQVLTIKNNNTCDWLRSYKKSVINVYVTVPSLAYVTAYGYGTIQSIDTINIDSFQVETKSASDVQLTIHSKFMAAHLFGSGNLTLTGICSQFNCNFYSGSGFVYCNELITGYVFLSSSTTGDSYIYTNGGLSALLYNDGNLYYSGNPTSISCQTYGKGQLIKE
jgi:hypothetical protein